MMHSFMCQIWEGPSTDELTLVVLDGPPGEVLRLGLPLLELRQRVEAEGLGLVALALGHLHDGRDELLEEGQLQQGRPVVVDEVDHQTLKEEDESRKLEGKV